MSKKLEDFAPELAVKVVKDISRALRSGHAVENPRLYRDPNSEYFRKIERLAVEEVYTWFAVREAPIYRDTLINLVRNRVFGLRAQGLWRGGDGSELPIPAYDTIRRRVNAICEEKYYEGSPPCLMVADVLLGKDATFYFPNPNNLPPEMRARVEDVLKRWKL